MKIRTKLLLLLSAALLVTTAASTWLQVRWTSNALETQVRAQAAEAAFAIGQSLEHDLDEDSDPDDISELLKTEVRRHKVARVELTFDEDEETTVNVNLGAVDEEANVKTAPRPSRRRPALRRDEIRRALSDRGATSRPPGERMIEPLWRTPDRADSPMWTQLAQLAPPAKPTPRGPFFVDKRDEQQKGARYFETPVSVELPGPRHGTLLVLMSLEEVDRATATQVRVSAAVTGTALLLLVIVAAFIANRVVVRPVEALARAMRGVSGGDLSLRVGVRGSDEVGKLGEGFNAMLERLAAADVEIRAFNRRLAEEVRAATADLARKNDALGHLNKLLVETRRELGDKERLAALGQLAAQLAHEIGTPLASVSGHLQLAMSAREATPPLRERLLKAARELERISRIVRDYLDSTRPIKPARVATDLSRLVDDAIGVALGAGERPGLRIERRIDEGAAQLETDPGLLRQILINLLTNAIDAAAQAGRGPEGEAHIDVSAASEGGLVEIRVRDNGVGIAAEDAARIFEPFYTTKGRGKGTGLGLAICRELARALGGRMSVESVPGEGSTFSVRLPALASVAPAGPITWQPSGRASA